MTLPTNTLTPALDATLDAFIGGRVMALQAKDGRHRSGLDAVMLAASLPADTRGMVVDLGAGCGVAGFCAAARLPEVSAVLVDNDRHALDLALSGLEVPENSHFADRVGVVEADIQAPENARIAAGLDRSMADHVIMNPPYRDPSSVRVSPNGSRAAAHVLDDAGLEKWLRTACSILRNDGSLTVIWPAERLTVLLNATSRRLGGISVFPLFPYSGEPANRVIVSGIKGSRAPLRLLPGLVLHETDGVFSPTASRVLRGGEGLFSDNIR